MDTHLHALDSDWWRLVQHHVENLKHKDTPAENPSMLPNQRYKPSASHLTGWNFWLMQSDNETRLSRIDSINFLDPLSTQNNS